MRTVWLWLLLAPLAPAHAPAAPAAGFHQGFEEQIPGQMPDGWAVTWGDAEGCFVGISNLAAAAGRCSVVVDRTLGGSTAGFKLSRNVPNPRSAWCLFQFCIRVEGAATDSRATVEVGPPHPSPAAKVVFSLRGWGPTIHLYPNAKGATWEENWKGKQVMANWTRGAWHRVSLAFPVAAGDGQAYGVVEQKGAGGEWQPVGQGIAVPATPTGGEEAFAVSLITEAAGSVVYLDEIRLMPCAARPELRAESERR